jgi:hypothetical protein
MHLLLFSLLTAEFFTLSDVTHDITRIKAQAFVDSIYFFLNQRRKCLPAIFELLKLRIFKTISYMYHRIIAHEQKKVSSNKHRYREKVNDSIDFV